MTKMELSKATESEIREVYQTYWDAYLRGDMETFGSFLDEHVVIYGTAVGEVFSSKQEALDFNACCFHCHFSPSSRASAASIASRTMRDCVAFQRSQGSASAYRI